MFCFLQDPPDLQKTDDDTARKPAADNKSRAQNTASPAVGRESTPKAVDDMDEQIKMLKYYEEQQSKLKDKQESEARRRADEKARQQREFEEQQRQQAERERAAQEALLRQQQEQSQQSQYAQQQQFQQNAGRAAELEREILAMRGQYERDQMMLEQYDRRVKSLEMEMSSVQQNIMQQMAAKDEMLRGIQDQGSLWRNKYEALAKLYSQLRNEHLDLLSKSKGLHLKANSAQESIDKMERMERDMKAKNLELADMIRERDRARFEMDRLKSVSSRFFTKHPCNLLTTLVLQNQKEDVERLRRDLRFAEERAEDATRSKGSEVSSMLSKYNRQLNELEDTVRVSIFWLSGALG